MKTDELTYPRGISGGSWRMETRKVYLGIDDILTFKDRAVFPWLVMAANPDLPSSKIEDYLASQGCPRPAAWIRKRRWMVCPAGTPVANGDGRDAQALQLMADNPEMSLRNMSALLEEHGIVRKKDWVRRYRKGNG